MYTEYNFCPKTSSVVESLKGYHRHCRKTDCTNCRYLLALSEKEIRQHLQGVRRLARILARAIPVSGYLRRC